MPCASCVDSIFDDKRLCVSMLMVWLALVIIMFKDIGLLDTSFVTFGPSESTKFMGIVLNTWYRWSMVAAFTFVNTSINDFMSDAISPWLINTMTDHKTKYIPYSKFVCLMISQFWSVYCGVMSVFGIFISMTQIDFVFIRIIADVTVNMYTNFKFMRNKIHCPALYNKALEVPAALDSYHQQQMMMIDSSSQSRRKETTLQSGAVLNLNADAELFCITSIMEDEDEENGIRNNNLKV